MLKVKAAFCWVLLFLSGCGFQPLYQRSSSPVLDSSPFILEVRGNNEEAYSTYKFKQELKPLIAKISDPSVYKITIFLSESFGDIGYGADASVLRSQGQLAATVQIYNRSYQMIYQNKLDVVSSYTADKSEEFSNLNAKMASRERLILSLVQDVARDIHRAVYKVK